MDKDWKEFLQQKKEEYKKIGSIECPAFNGELIYFTRDGLNHLIRKYGELRSKKEQARRLNLLKFVQPLIKNASDFSFSSGVMEGVEGKFYTFYGVIEGLEIKVVIRQINSGRKHFFSIKSIK